MSGTDQNKDVTGKAVAADTDHQEPEPGPAADDQALAKVRHEAANYRTKLREAEAACSALTERLQVSQRGEAERIAATDADGFRPLNDGADLWRAEGVELEGLLNEDGNIDAARVREAAAGVVADHPHWATVAAGDADAGKGVAQPQGLSNPFAEGLRGAAGR